MQEGGGLLDNMNAVVHLAILLQLLVVLLVVRTKSLLKNIDLGITES